MDRYSIILRDEDGNVLSPNGDMGDTTNAMVLNVVDMGRKD